MKWPDFTRIRSHTIRGKTFQLVWKKPYTPRSAPKSRHVVGLCDHPTTPGKEIWIWPRQDPYELHDVVLHEVTHAAFPDLEESAVEDLERSVSRLLKRMGMKIVFEPNE